MAFQKIPDAKQGDFCGNRTIDILTSSLLFLDVYKRQVYGYTDISGGGVTNHITGS